MVTLVILDGFGYRKEAYGNAIKAAGTPNLDKLCKKYPHTILHASSEHVGLPENTMGNSEVGHLTLGSGRVIPQALMEINNSIKDGSFFKNKALLKALEHAEKHGTLHLLGMITDIGVHSHIGHLFAILTAAKQYNIKNIYIHAFTDGRDCGVRECINYIKKIEEFLQKNDINNAKIASLCGRVYAMDRERRYDRIELVYDMLVNGKPCKALSPTQALQDSYDADVTDEFVKPILLDKNATIKDGDSVLLFNFRFDRMIEITDALTSDDYSGFKRKKKDIFFTQMTQSDDKFDKLNTLFPPKINKNNLSAIISKYGLKQFHISETTKYAHITFYFNGLIEDPYKGEDRKLIDSIDTKDFSYYPNMRAYEITEATLDAIASLKYDFILVNLTNPDMIGHTGNFEAAKQAITCIDKNAYAIALATLMAGGDCIITADHGNAEIMFDKQGNKVTSHTTSPVPCILVSEKYKKVKLQKNCSIANVAPTVLKLMNLKIPDFMTKPLF